VTTPPARKIPKYAMPQSALLGPVSPTTPPFSMPFDWSSAATASTLAAKPA
jgi:hypothetical protein